LAKIDIRILVYIQRWYEKEFFDSRTECSTGQTSVYHLGSFPMNHVEGSSIPIRKGLLSSDWVVFLVVSATITGLLVETGIDQGNLTPVKFAIVAANNHYAGFGPGTVNIFRQLLGLEEVKWGDEYVMSDDLARKDKDDDNHANLIKTKQTNLSDFL
jgi:hypothetical protein